MDPRHPHEIARDVYDLMTTATGVDRDEWAARENQPLTQSFRELGLDSLALVDMDWQIEKALRLPRASLPDQAQDGTVGQLVAWYVGRATSSAQPPPWPWPKPAPAQREVF